MSSTLYKKSSAERLSVGNPVPQLLPVSDANEKRPHRWITMGSTMRRHRRAAKQPPNRLALDVRGARRIIDCSTDHIHSQAIIGLDDLKFNDEAFYVRIEILFSLH